MKLTNEEKEIVQRFRELPRDKKKAFLASEDAFESWIKTAMKFVWGQITREIIRELLQYLREQFLGF
ncbi:hypothetical protein [Anabaenopsis elenkinii]|uniref:Uncharacterized protein n=1 Tax=Anabaenopsis elenkinii CCIBt3563 TaxID=2779889 RepID=A0A7S6REF8_9CYAN|nr:hypothetical protein [Anabaenopsis elenkinii]QOV22877.1 hypothetical protein IM676_00440 [Anabaenopsis elenkinii CCIBt3563]